MNPVTVFMVMNATPAKYLRQSVESILCQTMGSFDFLIVLDGYLVTERRQLEAYQDPRIQILEVEPGGLTAGLNAGLPHIRSPLIVRQDADDYSSPDRIEALMAGMAIDPRIGVIGDNYAVVGESGDVIRINTADPENVPPFRYKQWGLAGTIAGAGTMLRAEAVRQVGGWKYPVAQDCYMMHALRAHGWRVVSLKTTHYHWRQVRTSISHTRQAEQRQAVESILQEFNLRGV